MSKNKPRIMRYKITFNDSRNAILLGNYLGCREGVDKIEYLDKILKFECFDVLIATNYLSSFFSLNSQMVYHISMVSSGCC